LPDVVPESVRSQRLFKPVEEEQQRQYAGFHRNTFVPPTAHLIALAGRLCFSSLL